MSSAANCNDRDIDDIAAMENVVIVTVVGAGMRHTPGISGRVFGALGAERLNVIAIAQGSQRVQHQPDRGQAGCGCGGEGDSSVDCECEFSRCGKLVDW